MVAVRLAGFSHPLSRATAHVLFWLLVGGLLGALWWLWRGRKAPLRSAPVRVLQGVAAGLALALILVGTAWRAVTDLDDSPVCSSVPGEEWGSTEGDDGFTPTLYAQKLATWPETGLAMLYADATGTTVCRYAAAHYYVAVRTVARAGERSVNFGDVVLSPRFPTVPTEAGALAEHESRHRPQWAVATVLAGPAAFPIAYGVDDFFFPGARNHFERQAGLASGGYAWEGAGPVLGAPQVVVLVLMALALAAGALRLRRRRDRGPGRRHRRHPAP
ncbi:hypothetical protein GTQ99_22685 [Kineococcus sp. T13]|uniref:hypothetical protein n=1 Tax=Kineococcus vitellinus TaxID=2696565 RepID=UPI0014133B3B|nr:hypothetical protein [Kineococcus vitellinus]NAZ78193.1 hypothetical protein [Kineococcus vitellinus]